jgi:RNA-directed DNA polymerase
VSAVSASPTASGSGRGRVPADPVRALQHALYRAAKADPGRRFHALRDKTTAGTSCGMRG